MKSTSPVKVRPCEKDAKSSEILLDWRFWPECSKLFGFAFFPEFLIGECRKSAHALEQLREHSDRYAVVACQDVPVRSQRGHDILVPEAFADKLRADAVGE